jgi:Chaperone of endosialidase
MSCGCNGHVSSGSAWFNYTVTSNPINPVTYSIVKPTSASNIIGSKWTEIYNTINTERARRGAASISNPGFSGNVEANDLNTLSNGINYYWSDGIVSVGTNISASDLSYLIDKVTYCGSVCLCNCAYCTCNCNYCTCNCNYGCTCNCNYSDKRLKTNIKYIETQNGIKIYSFNYIWNLDKIEYGVIAQDLIGNYDNALIIEGEYYKVNYSLLPINLKGFEK